MRPVSRSESRLKRYIVSIVLDSKLLYRKPDSTRMVRAMATIRRDHILTKYRLKNFRSILPIFWIVPWVNWIEKLIYVFRQAKEIRQDMACRFAFQDKCVMINS
jgi:hypothetical protein